MKKILVPTDFSPVADNALKYAIELAGWFKSEIFLCHVYSFDKFNYNREFPKHEQPLTKKLERDMERLKLKFAESIIKNGLSIRTFVVEDIIFSLFNRKVIEFGVDIIVMGSTGASGISKIFFGSAAATAIQKAKVPVLVVPPDHAFQQLQNIVLTIDRNIVTPEVNTLLTNLAIKFDSKLTLLNVITKEKSRTYGKRNKLLEGVETVFREVRMTKSINETITEFIQKENSDLLCMIRGKRNFLERIFKKSITKVQVFSNDVPLLVFPGV